MNTNSTRTRTAFLHIIAQAAFSCERTCTPGHECGFGPLFRKLGRTRVVSHTTQVDVEFRDKTILGAAAEGMGGRILGEGMHRLYGGVEQGFGFTLKDWLYPLVLQDGGMLRFDDYNGHWGNKADIDTLKGKYAIEMARQVANQEGWSVMDMENGSLQVFHPSGGTMTVAADGTVDASGFVGTSCDAAQVIELSIGGVRERTDKPDYFGESAHIRQ